ncbi:MAG: biopolymer transporter ExbD [Thermosynechococcaceae cyanobacterium]
MRVNRQPSSIPEINLIPMLNVMMGILAFFVMITMTLSKQKSLEVQLPQDAAGQNQSIALADLKNQFVIDLDAEGQASQEKKLLSPEDLQAQVRQYLSDNPKGIVYVKPDPKLSYEGMMQKFDNLRGVGGDRISLIIE